MRVKISSLSPVPSEEKAEMKKHVQNGTLWDVIIEYDGGFARPIAYYPDSNEVAFYSISDETVRLMDLSD